MQNVSHIGLVDSHSKGDGRDNDVAILIEEGILMLDPLGGFQSGMVGQCIDAIHDQLFGKILHLLARQTINDYALALILA